MGTIRVEFVPVQKFGLGLLGLDHIQLVYEDETDAIGSQDYWYVLEGIQDGTFFGGTLGALGEDGRTSLGTANLASGADLIGKIGTPESRGSRIITTGPNVLSFWDKMAAYGAGIQDMQLPYIAATLPFSVQPTINSTSFIASVLHSIGVNVSLVMPFGVRFSPGATTLIGTPENDDLGTDDYFSTLVTGQGQDSLHGTSKSYEKFYGGADNDTIHWSNGDNVIHGGQARMAYADDGLDTVDYSGAGTVHLSASKHAIEHKVADYFAEFDGGTDQLFSIEAVAWDRANDHIIAGEGLELLEKPLFLDPKDNGGGKGDILGLTDTDKAVIINAVSDTMISVQTLANAGEDAGFWSQSVEWLAGSNGDDLIYTNAAIRGAEGAGGNDLLDGRLSAAYSGQSPNGYDVEFDGGDGNDTIVSGAGRTFAHGGAGGDMFVLTAMSSGNGTVEFVIDDGAADDKLYVPYDFFRVARGDYDGSQLFQLTGAPFKIDDITTTSGFRWGIPSDDQIHGLIEFSGRIDYSMSGSDLIISLYQGHPETRTVDYGPGEPPGPTTTVVVRELETLTTIRVKDWSEGDLGLTFPLVWNTSTFANSGGFENYPGYQAALAGDTNASHFIAPLDDRPDAHLPTEFATASGAAARTSTPLAAIGTEQDDILIASGPGPYRFDGKGGNDTITGSAGGDHLNGGTGADTLIGGRGNDTYYVDNAGDVVVEDLKSGFDRVVSTIDYTLGNNVEHLVLAGTAINGTGNSLRNTLEGNELNNVLTGGGGDDTLAGDAGDDTLIGGDGGDGYVYEIGDGSDVIIETAGTNSGGDVLVLAGTLRPEDVLFVRNPNANDDLILSFTDGGHITIKNYFAGGGAGIEGIEFTTGTVWSAADVAAHASLARVTANDAPIARDDAYTVFAQPIFTIPIAALLDNDRDPEADTLTLLSVSNATGGTVTIDGLGNVVLQPLTTASSSTLSFDYTIGDGHGGTSTANFNLSLFVTSTNHVPTVTSATMSAAIEDTLATGQIVANDVDGGALVYRVNDGDRPAKGAVSVNADGTFVYTPNANANGADSFTVTTTDDHGAFVTHTFNFTITPVNDAPVVSGTVTGNATEDGAVLSIDALINASDVDTGDTLQVTGVPSILPAGVTYNAATHAFTLNGSNAAYQHLAAGATQTVTVSYGVTDGALTVPASVTFTVAGVNDAALIGGTVTGSVKEDTTLTASGTLTVADVDDGQSSYQTGAYTAAHGSLVLAADGTWTYTLNNTDAAVQALNTGQSITDTVSVKSFDGTAKAITISINGLNEGIYGTEGADTLFGTAAADVIYGLGGKDIIRSGSGNDIVFGGLGNDAINGEAGDDTLYGNEGNDTLTGDAGKDILYGGDGTDGFFGGGGDDTIYGEAGNDTMYGDGGNDKLDGGTGNDILIGSTGSDTFIFNTGFGKDVISDFTATGSTHDVVEIKASLFANWAAVEGAISDSASGAVIALDANNTITLTGVTKAVLIANHVDDFRFV